MKRKINIDGVSREVIDIFVATVFAGSTGSQGGDWGHGSRSVFGIHNDGSMAICIEVVDDMGERKTFDFVNEFKVIVGGDQEVSRIPGLLRFMADALENKVDINADYPNGELCRKKDISIIEG